MRFHAFVACLFSLCAALSSHACTRSYARRAVDGSNLRQIGQAALIYAAEHHDRLPQATDVWDYASLLAAEVQLSDAELWQSRLDPAYDPELQRDILISGTPGQSSSRLHSLKPAYAVAIGSLTLRSPSTTPIAWTRGLQPDGTWAKHSPYGGAGGWIVFTNGHATFYENLHEGSGGKLTRYDGIARTANILEALPPGSRISEYVPTQAEQAAWSARPPQRFWSPKSQRLLGQMALFGIVCLPFVIIAVKRLIQRRRLTIGLLLWPAFLCVVFAIVVPTAC